MKFSFLDVHWSCPKPIRRRSVKLIETNQKMINPRCTSTETSETDNTCHFQTGPQRTETKRSKPYSLLCMCIYLYVCMGDRQRVDFAPLGRIWNRILSAHSNLTIRKTNWRCTRSTWSILECLKVKNKKNQVFKVFFVHLIPSRDKMDNRKQVI